MWVQIYCYFISWSMYPSSRIILIQTTENISAWTIVMSWTFQLEQHAWYERFILDNSHVMNVSAWTAFMVWTFHLGQQSCHECFSLNSIHSMSVSFWITVMSWTLQLEQHSWYERFICLIGLAIVVLSYHSQYPIEHFSDLWTVCPPVIVQIIK